MRELGLGGYRSIDKYVKAKLEKLDGNPTFLSLFELMFSEKDNILFEQSAGYRIVYTTYGEGKQKALDTAARIKARFADLPQGAVIGLYMDNGLGWIVTFWGIILAGFCPLLMNMRLPAGMLEGALADMKAAAVISDGEKFTLPTVGLEDLESLTGAELPAVCGDEVYVMSSGTSQRLKICGYTAREFAAQIIGSYDIIKKCRMVKRHYGGSLKLLTFLPFYHIFGLVAVYIWFAFFSRTFVHLADMNPATIVNTVKRHNVTHIFAVPLFWEKVYERAVKTVKSRGAETEQKFNRGMAISRKIGDVPLLGSLFTKLAFKSVRDKMFGESIKFMITGGSYIPGDVLEFFNRIGYPLANGYGMTEIGITSVELSSKMKIRAAGFVGSPLKGIEYSVNGEGELLVRGKSCAHSICEGGRRYLLEGAYPTGDLAECKGGRYRILGRRDDVIIAANGENVNPELIEPCFKIEDTCGVALISERTGEGVRPVLLVSLKRSLTAQRFKEIDEAIKSAASKAGVSKLIGKTVYTLDPVMRDNEFKLNRARLSREYNGGKLNILPEGYFASRAEADEDAV
ncbi:MAG: AMP-binding protein, partial [Clostridia bacterium]|nr:AMP-binding protein [Clostridia bacterium]